MNTPTRYSPFLELKSHYQCIYGLFSFCSVRHGYPVRISMYNIIFALLPRPVQAQWFRAKGEPPDLIFWLIITQDEALIHGIAAHTLYVLPSLCRLLCWPFLKARPVSPRISLGINAYHRRGDLYPQSTRLNFRSTVCPVTKKLLSTVVPLCHLWVAIFRRVVRLQAGVESWRWLSGSWKCFPMNLLPLFGVGILPLSVDLLPLFPAYYLFSRVCDCMTPQRAHREPILLENPRWVQRRLFNSLTAPRTMSVDCSYPRTSPRPHVELMIFITT